MTEKWIKVLEALRSKHTHLAPMGIHVHKLTKPEEK